MINEELKTSHDVQDNNQQKEKRASGAGENFWKDRKESFIKLKIWEDNRNNVTH